MSLDFENWWKKNGVKCEVGILEAAFKELAQKSWEASQQATARNLADDGMIAVPIEGSHAIHKAIREAVADHYFDSGVWNAAIRAAFVEQVCTANVFKS